MRTREVRGALSAPAAGPGSVRGRPRCPEPGSNPGVAASFGTTPDLPAEYSATSRDTIDANRLSAGGELADYVLATAGKGGAVPFNSTSTRGRDAIVNMPHRACQ